MSTDAAQQFQDAFLAERRIDPNVARGRGYTPIRAGHPEDVYNTSPVMRMHRNGRRNRDWVKKFTTVDGTLMPKHSAFDGLAPIRPQLRPKRAIIDKIWRHRHKDGTTEVMTLKLWDLDPDDPATMPFILAQPESAWEPGGWMSEGNMRDHLKSDKRKDEHAAVKTKRSLHVHIDPAKYAIAPEEHERLLVGRSPDEWEEWEWDDSKRLDVHPFARQAFEAGERGPVFFGIEGTPKNDSMISWLLRNDRPPLVFNVPGVSMWHAPELALFVLTYIEPTQPVVIVPDADWATNPEVIFHAENAALYIHKVCGIERVRIAAPPVGLGLKGVDDFLGAEDEHSLLDMGVIERAPDPDAFRDWAAEYTHQRRREKATAEFDIRVAQTLAQTSGNDGTALRQASAISRAMFGRKLTIEEARERSVPEERLTKPWTAPIWQEAWDRDHKHIKDRERRVHDALRRLGEGGAFEATGKFPDWAPEHWTRARKRDGSAGWRLEPEGPTSRIEFVRLNPKLVPIVADPVPLRDLLA